MADGESWLPWATFFLFLLIIVVLIIGIIYYSITAIPSNNLNPSQVQQEISNQLVFTRPPVQWGPSQAGPTPIRNTCQLYTFPAVMQGNIAILGRPTFRPQEVESLTPGGPPGNCIDIDQLALQQYQRQCIIQQCTDEQGNTYNYGEVVTYYGLCGTGSSQCNDILGVIAINFQASAANDCLSIPQSPNPIVIKQPCSLASDEQLLQVIRYQPTGKIDNSAGPYASVRQRATGLYLAPVSVSVGSLLTASLASALPNNGVIWWLFPNFQFLNTGVFPPKMQRVPPQLIYWTDITSTPPSTNEQMVLFLRTNAGNMYAVTYNDQGQVVLDFMNLDGDQAFNSQLLNYDIYNILEASDTISKSW